MKPNESYNFLRKDIMRCLLALEYFAIIGIALYNIAKDLNMQNTEKFASVISLIGFILPLTWLICDSIYIHKIKKKKNTSSKDFQMNLTGLEEQWNNLDKNKQCGIYAKVYKFIQQEINKNEKTTKQQN